MHIDRVNAKDGFSIDLAMGAVHNDNAPFVRQVHNNVRTAARAADTFLDVDNTIRLKRRDDIYIRGATPPLLLVSPEPASTG
jgi:hypothetical protein